MKALKLVVLTCFSAIWLLGISNYDVFFPTLFEKGILIDSYRYGDFYNLTHLSQFKEEMVKCPTEPPVEKETSKPIHLYAIGDSFLEPQRIDSADFLADKFKYFHWDHKLYHKLDTNAINVILLESIERHFRQHIDATQYVESFIPHDSTYVENTARERRGMARLDELLNSERIEGQLGMLFNSNPLGMKFKQFRSDFNYNVFDRTESSVTISDDKKHIVYYLDTDSLNFPHTSGFAQIRESKIDSIVDGVNKLRAELIEQGFDHVLFSIIPNKSTIVMPEYGTYNHLIERLQSHPKLKTPFVSVIDEYRAMGEKAYLKSDSHWTCDARLVWLRKMNLMLNKITSGDFSEKQIIEECQVPTSKKSLINAAI